MDRRSAYTHHAPNWRGIPKASNAIHSRHLDGRRRRRGIGKRRVRRRKERRGGRRRMERVNRERRVYCTHWDSFNDVVFSIFYVFIRQAKSTTQNNKRKRMQQGKNKQKIQTKNSRTKTSTKTRLPKAIDNI